MRQVVANARENRETVIRSDDVNAPCRVGKGAAPAPPARRPIEPGPARGRAVRITAAFLTATFLATAFLVSIWTSEVTAGALSVQTDQVSPVAEKSVQPAQAMTDDPEQLQTALDQEHHRAELVARELTAVRHLEMLLRQHKIRLESAQFWQLPENEYAELVKSLQQEQEPLKRAADSGVAELCKSSPGDPAERLAQDLAVARRDVETKTALAAKATDEASQAKQAAESSAAELRKSLQQEQERGGRLEQDLATARRDVGTQTALVAKANEDATRSKQAAEDGSAALKRSLQKEHDRAEALTTSLSMVHTAIYTYEVQARIASDQAASCNQAEQSGAAELRKSLVHAWERTARLEQELVAAQRDVETQTALVAKAGAEAARLKQAADASSAESLRSLQQERDKSARLEQELASERKTKGVPAASGGVTAGRITQDKRPDAFKPVAVNQATAAAARSDVRPDPQNTAEVPRLLARASVLLGQGDIGSARIVLERAAETGNAQASFALAETYDPLVLRKWGAYGTPSDAAKARDLYARAQAGGIKEARERFDALRR
jgi:hypothetical protein